MIKTKGRLVSESFPLNSEIKEEAQKFVRLVKSAKKILISSTLTSDGDSVGSQTALAYLIEKLRDRKNADDVWIVNESPVPERYSFLQGSDRILSTKDWRALKDPKPNFDLGIVCDGGIERTGDIQELFSSIPKTILVDHHAVGSKLHYEARILDLESSSTCELVYHLFEAAGVEVPAAVAEALFVGIVFDTGFFKHSLTKPRTHYVAAHLISTGIDFSKISDRAILERSWEAQLLLKSLLDHMERRANGKIIVSYWKSEDLQRIGPKDGDQEGMINQLYYTEGAEVVALFSEKDTNEVKISFRSKGKVNVAEFARTLNPGGGGHVRAAGCTLQGRLSDVRERVLKQLEELL